MQIKQKVCEQLLITPWILGVSRQMPHCKSAVAGVEFVFGEEEEVPIEEASAVDSAEDKIAGSETVFVVLFTGSVICVVVCERSMVGASSVRDESDETACDVTAESEEFACGEEVSS